MNLSFAGCGFLGIYHVGVAVCFKKYAPHLLLNEISGASFGALAACSLLCEVPIGDLASDVLNIATEARSRTLGPFHPSFNIQKILTDRLDKILPEDAHIRVSGRLHISLTRVTDGKNIVVSEFSSRDELIQALNASCFIPFFSGILPPRIQGYRCMDGGFSDNLPTLDENTITVSPFCGESDICPRDDSMQLFHINVANTSIELSKHNIYRIGRILFPPKPEILSNMCKQGFDDALRFLHRNNLINCTRCLSVQSTFTVQTTIEEGLEYDDPECHDCKTHRQEALVSNLPDAVLAIFQDAINTANKGLANWIFKHRGMKVLSVLTLPYTLPADVMVATLTNAVGETYEKRNLEYNVVTRTLVRPARKCKCGNTIESGATSSSSSSSTNNSLIGTMPIVGSKLWELSSYFASQLISRGDQKENRPHIVRNEDGYIHKSSDIESGWQANVTSNQQPSVAFLSDNIKPSSSRPPSRTLSRRSSLTVFNAGEIHLYDDTFENIVEVANNHESIMSYYYSTGDNKVNVMEIFDVSESDSPVVQSQREKDANQQLEFDDDWEASVWMTGRQDSQFALEDDCTGVEITALDDVFDQDQGGMFSDPESEWSPSQVEEFDEDDNIGMKSECDQMTAGAEVLSRPYEVPSFTYGDHSS